MRKLMQTRSKLVEKMQNIEHQLDTTNEKLIAKINSKLHIMNEVELKVLRQEKFKTTSYAYQLRSVKWNISNIHKIKVSGGMIKIQTVEYSCGDSDLLTIKIPEAYFSMTNDEIREAHTKWANETVEKIIAKAEKRKRASIENQIKSLQSQL